MQLNPVGQNLLQIAMPITHPAMEEVGDAQDENDGEPGLSKQFKPELISDKSPKHHHGILEAYN